MKINIQNIVPQPLSDQISDSEIWNSDVEFNSGYTQINASSGKGKSTFIHVLYGLRKDFTGKVLLDNKDISDMSHNEWTQIRKNKISVVFQDLQLFPKLSTLDNVLLKNQLTNTFSQDQIIELLIKVGLEKQINQSAGTLSYGQQQRVAIVRALAQPFEWLLLDEPFSHLDNENAKICSEIITESVQKNSGSVIYTSLGGEDTLPTDKILKL